MQSFRMCTSFLNVKTSSIRNNASTQRSQHVHPKYFPLLWSTRKLVSTQWQKSTITYGMNLRRYFGDSIQAVELKKGDIVERKGNCNLFLRLKA